MRNDMKTFSIRIEENLFNKMEEARGEKVRTDFLREVIVGYFLKQRKLHRTFIEYQKATLKGNVFFGNLAVTLLLIGRISKGKFSMGTSISDKMKKKEVGNNPT